MSGLGLSPKLAPSHIALTPALNGFCKLTVSEDLQNNKLADFVFIEIILQKLCLEVGGIAIEMSCGVIVHLCPLGSGFEA